MPYLVDGNNLAHALGLSNDGLADRQAVAREVSAFCQSQGASATIVFDGPSGEGPQRPGDTSRVRILFSGKQSADEAILKLISGSSTPKDFTVVTSDKSLGDKAKHRGASVEKAHQFARRLKRPSGGGSTPSGKPMVTESAAQIEAWLSVFDPKRNG